MKNIEKEIKKQLKYYKKLYKPKLTESLDIGEYGENEFFGGKKEAFKDVLELFSKYRI